MNASFPLIIPFGSVVDKNRSRSGCAWLECWKLDVWFPLQSSFVEFSPHKRWFLRPVNVNAMQIIRGNILFCWPMMSCFGCIISSHLFGLKNNQNESLFSTWINVYLSIPFANMIWSKASFRHNEYTRHMKWICCRFNERIFNSKKNYIISITTLYGGQCLKSERITNDLHQMQHIRTIHVQIYHLSRMNYRFNSLVAILWHKSYAKQWFCGQKCSAFEAKIHL